MINKTKPSSDFEAQPLPAEIYLRLEDLEEIVAQFKKFADKEISRLEADRAFLENLTLSGLTLSTRIARDSLTSLAAKELDRIKSEGVV